MTLKEIYDALSATNIHVTYLQWREGAVPALPYICYYLPQSNNFCADNGVYKGISRLNVELYTAEKEPGTESALESALAGLTGFWNKAETFLDSENMYEVIYDGEVLIDG